VAAADSRAMHRARMHLHAVASILVVDRRHPRRRDGRAAHLPQELPLVVDVRGEWDDEGRDEDEDDLVRRMERAASYAGGVDRIATSPQWGFASVMLGNETNEDAQWRKLELVGKVADRLWG